jgi:hypothetical protein
LKDIFNDKAKFTFTFIGSENHVSKSLFDTYFHDKPDTANYYEFDQGNVTAGYSSCFLSMISEKCKFAFMKSIEKNPNITLLNGSNDFISINFFEQIINGYDSKQSQIFGIDNFFNGKNCSNILLYDYSTNNFIDEVIWSGIQHPARQKYKYIGGIIGWNDTFYNKNKLYLNKDCREGGIISFDEGEIEFISCSIPTTVKFQSTDCFFLNIKSGSSDITTYEHFQNFLNEHPHLSLCLSSSSLSDETQKKLMFEKEMFLNGYK